MHIDYVLRRFLIFLLIIWAASTLNFFLPKFSAQNPIRDKLTQEFLKGGYQQSDIEKMVKEYDVKFGFDKPLWQQYLNYWGDMLRLDFNYSMANYPKKVSTMMLEALPWTIGLLGLTTVMAFLLGTFIGAVMGWPSSSKLINNLLMPPLLWLSGIPYYILGLLLLYVFSFQLKLLPIFGGYTAGTIPNWSSLAFWWDVLQHAFLPALSIILSALGFWALGMRAMMVTTLGEDYMTFAEAKGLKDRTMFTRYAIRNALLPQVTTLALQVGYILSGAVLVELVFGYPGIGTTLYQAIRSNDYFVIQGVVVGIIGSIALMTLLLDLIYPLLDPRITYRST